MFIYQDAKTLFVVQLVLITSGQRVLLGKKKRGFGQGYFNGFGGKVALSAARRPPKRALAAAALLTMMLLHRWRLGRVSGRPQRVRWAPSVTPELAQG